VLDPSAAVLPVRPDPIVIVLVFVNLKITTPDPPAKPFADPPSLPAPPPPPVLTVPAELQAPPPSVAVPNVPSDPPPPPPARPTEDPVIDD